MVNKNVATWSSSAKWMEPARFRRLEELLCPPFSKSELPEAESLKSHSNSDVLDRLELFLETDFGLKKKWKKILQKCINILTILP